MAQKKRSARKKRRLQVVMTLRHTALFRANPPPPILPRFQRYTLLLQPFLGLADSVSRLNSTQRFAP
jgi:hypothetical protein